MLTSLQNPLVKQLRRLHQAKGRKEEACFLVEGTHLLEAALSTGLPLMTVCATPKWQARYPQLSEQACLQAQRIELVSPEVLAAIATTVNPDGVVASIARSAMQNRQPAMGQLGVVLETLQDPGNLGTVIRTAAAAGVDGLWLSADSVDLDHPKVLRASAGQWFQLPMVVSEDLVGTMQQWRDQGYQLVATQPHAAQVYWHLDFTRPTVLLLGNEGAGLSPDLVALADQAVKIPLNGGVESLNVAIAAALLLYEAYRQRYSIGYPLS
jgi:TrmH family RNA methyltransferase